MQSLQEIKKLRKKLGINQKELADKAQVSQSLIAKIEAGTVEPTFSKAQQIFQALEEFREKEEVKAGQIMNKKVIFVEENDSVKEIITLMKKRGISQIPVMNKNNVSGLLTEKSILNNLIEHNIETLKVMDVMEDAPPIVSLNTGQQLLLELLKDYPIILVAEKGEIKGIISKSDLLGKF
jgi:predicted transcriptional regulator